MPDFINYKDAFIKTKIIQSPEGNLILDLPFQIYHQTIVENGNNHYCYITNDLKDKEVIVYIHYAIADESKVKSFSGYLGDDWQEVQKNPDVIKHWFLKKEDALAVSIPDKDNPEIVIKTKYIGTDSQKIVHPYQAEDK